MQVLGLFCTFSSVTVQACPSVFRVHSWVWGSHGQRCPLPESDINACVSKAWPGVFKNFSTSAKNFRTIFKISEHPGLSLWCQTHDLSSQPNSITACWLLSNFPAWQNDIQRWFQSFRSVQVISENWVSFTFTNWFCPRCDRCGLSSMLYYDGNWQFKTIKTYLNKKIG